MRVGASWSHTAVLKSAPSVFQACTEWWSPRKRVFGNETFFINDEDKDTKIRTS